MEGTGIIVQYKVVCNHYNHYNRYNHSLFTILCEGEQCNMKVGLMLL